MQFVDDHFFSFLPASGFFFFCSPEAQERERREKPEVNDDRTAKGWRKERGEKGKVEVEILQKECNKKETGKWTLRGCLEGGEKWNEEENGKIDVADRRKDKMTEIQIMEVGKRRRKPKKRGTDTL